MTITADIQKPDPGALVELFELDTRPIGGIDRFYFIPALNADRTAVVWQGITYNPYSIEAEGFEVTARGPAPRPHLKVSNTSGIMSAVVTETDDLVGAKVIRRRTLAQYLDGEPTADPSQFFPEDVYYVEKKVREHRAVVEWELASVLDLSGVQLPSRLILTDHCPWAYRSAECSYTGQAYFNAQGEPVNSPEEDVCSKQVVSGCKVRFGTGRLPFGGFPGARNFRA